LNRDTLLQREGEAWTAFARALEHVPPEQRGAVGVVPGWSAHDILSHCASCVAWASDVIERVGRGEPEPDMPEDEAAWDAEILATGRTKSWDEAFDDLELNRNRIRSSLSVLDDPPELAVKWFTNETFDHYDEHGAQIRAFHGLT
jgi:Mycothiol maleylpyruvate isomerase N-terminal domain